MDGSTFNKNFLLISAANKYAVQNRKAQFYVDVVDDIASWQNFPPLTLFRTLMLYTWAGTREVIYRNPTNIIVRITETIPVQGRVWTIRYDGTSWNSWTVTGQAFSTVSTVSSPDGAPGTTLSMYATSDSMRFKLTGTVTASMATGNSTGVEVAHAIVFEYMPDIAPALTKVIGIGTTPTGLPIVGMIHTSSLGVITIKNTAILGGTALTNIPANSYLSIDETVAV